MAHKLALAAFAALPCTDAARAKSFLDGACNALTNRGSFSTVEVSIGTPPQKMHLVADTGSDLCLVESCACVDSGSCAKKGPCFRGGNGKSSTFSLDEKPKQMTIHYGSGPLDTVVATDTVRMGGIEARMDHSLMLISRNRLKGHLQIDGGILGFGLPHGKESISTQKGFLDTAKVPRFAMCFNDDGKDGLLRMGHSLQLEKPLLGIGQQHWGLDFRGISVGDAQLAQASFCTTVNEAGQETPCGAIVDSGTTLILAPQEQLTSLLASLCDGWQRCKEHSSSIMLSLPVGQAAEASLAAKAKALHQVAADCSLEGMPTLHFHVRGKDGTQDTLEMTPNDYMVETRMKSKFSDWLGVSEPKKVCRPAFEKHSYSTKKNGPVWLLGTPFFYKYNVAYDRSTSPPSISFNRNGCGSCQASGTASFIAQRASTRRHLDTEPRVSFINTTLPL